MNNLIAISLLRNSSVTVLLAKIISIFVMQKRNYKTIKKVGEMFRLYKDFQKSLPLCERLFWNISELNLGSF